MYPDISYFFHDIFGSAVDNWTSFVKTFGFLLVMALLACGVFLKQELKRYERNGLIGKIYVNYSEQERTPYIDIVLNALILCFLCAKIPLIASDFSQFTSDPASIILSSKGNWALGFLVFIISIGYSYYQYSKNKALQARKDVSYFPSDKANDIIIIAGVSGVIGSKLFSVFEDFSGFIKNPLDSLLSGSGLNVYGGLILAFVVVYYYIKKLGIKPIYMMDIAGMGILLGYGLGRLGCQFSGDGDWGIVASEMPSWWFLPDWIWSYHYPNNVNNDGILLSQCDPVLFKENLINTKSYEEACKLTCGMRYCHQMEPKVYPTPIYETVMSLLAFTVLYIKRKSFKVPGTIFFIYMMFNGIERFFIEFIRVNDKYKIGNLNWSQAQYISVLFVVIGLAGLYYILYYNKSNVKNSV